MSDKSGRIGAPKRAFVPVDDKAAAKARDSEKSPEKETASASLKTDLNRAHRPENSSSSASSTSAMTADDYPDTTKPIVSTKVPDRSSDTANNPHFANDENSAHTTTPGSRSSAAMPQNDLLLKSEALVSDLRRMGYDGTLSSTPTPAELTQALCFCMGGKKGNIFFRMMMSLIAAGADPNTAKLRGMTSLDFAAHFERLDVVEFLIARGAGINDAANRTPTALGVAISRCFVLREPDSSESYSPESHSDSYRGAVAIVEFLVRHNAAGGRQLEREVISLGGYIPMFPPFEPVPVAKIQIDLIKFLLAHGHYCSWNLNKGSDFTASEKWRGVPDQVREVFEDYYAARAPKKINFDAYELLNSTLHWFAAQAPAASTGTSSSTTSSSTTTSSTSPATSPAPSLANLSLHSVCENLVAGNFSIESIPPLIARVAGTSSAITQAVIHALALAQADGKYANKGHSDQVDHGVRLALQDAGLWDDYLETREKFAIIRNNIDRYQANGQTLLTQAALAGDIEMIRTLVRLGTNVQLPNQTGYNAAAVAASAGQFAAMAELLSHGINANNTGPDDRSALHYVAQAIADSNGPDIKAMASLVRYLLLKGYRFDAANPAADDGSTLADLLTSNPERLLALGPELIAQSKKS